MRMTIAHATREAIAPSRVADQVIPPALDALILRCLAKAADERPASAAAMADEIRATGLAEGWTTAGARRWWSDHLADRIGVQRPRTAPRRTQSLSARIAAR